MSDIYAKISVYEIKIGTLNTSLILQQQVMVMNDSQGELLTTITQILVRLVILAVKYVIFINVYTTSLLKSSLCLPLRYLWANDYKGKGISGHYIFCSRVNFSHRMQCLVFTDTDLCSITKGKAYLANKRWRRSTCLRDQWYGVGC